MEFFWKTDGIKESFGLFKKARGCATSKFVLDVLSTVTGELTRESLNAAFGKLEDPRAQYFAGIFADGAAAKLELFKKSCNGGFSWGSVGYAYYVAWDEDGLVSVINMDYNAKVKKLLNRWRRTWICIGS
jgi:hypothetical protein